MTEAHAAPDPSVVALHGDPDDVAFALRWDESRDGSAEVVVVLQGAQAWRARVPASGWPRFHEGVRAFRDHLEAEDAGLTHEAPHGTRFELGRPLAAWLGLAATRHGAWFMVEGHGAEAGVGLVAFVHALRGLAATVPGAPAA